MPPLFPRLFGKVQQCCILRDQTTGDLKSHHLEAGVTALSVPPSPTFSFSSTWKVFFCLFGLFGGGGDVTLRPPLGPALQTHIIVVYMSNRRMQQSYIQNAIHCRACTDISTITRRRKLGAYWFRVVHVKSRIFQLQFED